MTERTFLYISFSCYLPGIRSAIREERCIGCTRNYQRGGLSMASKRCLPTRFFKDADIMNVSKDAQLILVGLVLLADDEGRELAHPRLLSREIDYPPEQIEAALQELSDNDLVLLYQAGKHR